jgi:hypothetical protein
MLYSMQHVSLLIIIYFLNHDQLINSCTMICNQEIRKLHTERNLMIH